MRRGAIVLILVALAPATTARAAPAAVDFANPVIAGNVPDPSIARTYDVFWATGTSGYWAPLFPIFSSRDLVNWQPRGAALVNAPSWAIGRFWAPDLSWWRGRLWLY
jgi:beta-xylosidase